jgi:hypothetical protein
VSQPAAAADGSAAAAAAPEEEGPLVNGLTVEQRFQLCRSIGEECITGECVRVLRYCVFWGVLCSEGGVLWAAAA